MFEYSKEVADAKDAIADAMWQADCAGVPGLAATYAELKNYLDDMLQKVSDGYKRKEDNEE